MFGKYFNAMKAIAPSALLIIASLAMLLSATPPVDGQDKTESELEADVVRLVRRLRNLSIVQLNGDDEANIERQRKKIDIANQILDHDFAEEPHRAFAAIARLQALGIQFSIVYKNETDDSDLLDEYSAAIVEGIKDSDERIEMEATTAGASFRTALFQRDPNEVTSAAAATALKRLNDLAPSDPLIQSTRRRLLEEVWQSEKPKLVFEKLLESNKDMASIPMDQLNEKTEKAKADFLWAKHFSQFNDFVAQRRLASMYESGEGTRLSNSQAARWYTKLARIGDLHSRVKLADFYLEGKGYSKDLKAAVNLYREAANDGSRVAQFKLGQCYSKGIGVSQSDENWRKWIKNAAFNATGIEVQEIYTAIDFANAADSYRIFYESLVDQNPGEIYYLNNFAYSLLISSEKDPDRSLELINRAIELAPKNFSGMSNFLDTKATALMQKGEIENAVKIFESVLQDIDDKKPVLKSLIECYKKLDSEKAAEYQKQLDKLTK